MSAIVILEAEVKEGQRDTLIKLLSKHLPETRKYRGFVDISIQSEQTNNKLIFYQEWESFEDYEAYLQWRRETGVMKELVDTLDSPPLIRYFNTVDV